MTEVFELSDPQEVIAKFEEISASGELFAMVFTGGPKPDGDGASWCPDCDVAKPAILKAIEDNSTGPVIKAIVQTRDEWVGVADHPLKKHPNFKVTGIPTMVVFQGTTEMSRVVELDDFANEDLMETFALN